MGFTIQIKKFENPLESKQKTMKSWRFIENLVKSYTTLNPKVPQYCKDLRNLHSNVFTRLRLSYNLPRIWMAWIQNFQRVELRFHKRLRELHLKEVLQDEVSTLHEVDMCEILEHWVEKLVLYK